MTPNRDSLLRLRATARRVAFFARDWWDEMPAAWSLARMRDCERNGGHQWGKPYDDEVLKSHGRECGRCGTFEMVAQTTGTTASNTKWMYHVDA
jgi:hypothetical protein